jgi:hypothetical protein
MAILLIMMILGLGAAVLLGHGCDSRDPEYSLGGLVGRTPVAADGSDAAEAAETPVLTVPAGWLSSPEVTAR